MKKQTLFQIITLIVSIILIFAAYSEIVGKGTIFKGEMEGTSIKARVIRITNEVQNENIKTVYFKAEALSTELRGKTIDVIQEIDENYAFCPPEVKQGDTILIEAYTEKAVTKYYFGDFFRITPLLFLSAFFCLLVIFFSGKKGFKTLVSLLITCLAVFCVLVPAVLNGRNIYIWSILCCVFVTFVTLTLISGYNSKALCSITGCTCGVCCAGLITVFMNSVLNMTGLLEEESVYLVQLYPDNPINLKAIIFAMIITGALGAVMDVSMSLSASLAELKIKSHDITAKELMKSGFRIGGDMMGTMANTLILAYIGSNLTCVLLLVSYNANLNQILNKEVIVAEILQALAGSIGMLLTLPITAATCSIVYSKRGKENVFD